VISCTDKPEIPKPPIFQPIVDQEICDDSGSCERINECREFRINEIGNYELFQVHELKTCHGILGHTSDGHLEITNAMRQLKDWMLTHCRSKRKIKSYTFPELDIQ